MLKLIKLNPQPSPLFRKIENKEIEELKKKFAGKSDISQSEEQAIADQLAETRITVPKDITIEEIEKNIKEQGDHVRKLKMEKASKKIIELEVNRLKQWKKVLEEGLSGS